MYQQGSEGWRLDFAFGADFQRITGALHYQGQPTEIREYYPDLGYECVIDVAANVRYHLYYESVQGKLVNLIVKEEDLLATGGSGAFTSAAGAGYHYVYTDHLGSILTVTDDQGAVVATQNFDAWGRRRDPATWDYTNVPTTPIWLLRGFTGHEQLDELGLIHMNGRLYDPLLGRMLSPDNHVQSPYGTQGYNRYAYCYNNPLKYTDPSGEWVHIVVGAALGGAINLAMNWNSIDNFWEGAAAFGIGAGAGALTAATGGATSGFFATTGAAVGAAAVGGAATGMTNNLIAQTGSGTGLSGVNWGQVGIGAGVGALSGVAGYGAGQWAANNLGGVVINGLNVQAKSAIGQGVAGAIGGAAGGYAGGFTGGYLSTGDLGAAHNTGMSGMFMGAAIGGALGLASGYASASKNPNVNPWTGNPHKSVTIGENQIGRVNPAAKGLNSRTISDDYPNGLGSNLGEEFKTNEYWIRLQVEEGVTIYDLGPDPSRSFSSRFYHLEQQTIQSYDTPHIYRVQYYRKINVMIIKR